LVMLEPAALRGSPSWRPMHLVPREEAVDPARPIPSREVRPVPSRFRVVPTKRGSGGPMSSPLMLKVLRPVCGLGPGRTTTMRAEHGL